MARLFAIIATLFLASSTVVAAPLDFGKILSKCNLDRFNIVTSLAATGVALAKIDTSDADMAAAVGTAKSGLVSAGEGIGKIALALISGGAPPADARDQTQQGLLNAQQALAGVTANEKTKASLAAAQTKLAKTIQDGNDVVADCQPSA
ncbi:hypothetical protein MIND_00665300 [Mycena indigotica]|uniref:Uncharacterized protein n=1 Tax=Mycena indigotica TaxID=2126181 RepID=A0A8H6SMM0_9AGAR|nr:uncharacterized protein MIND_00665300 [Mycena indigotica]KAF7301017.1 hypothetical protein MIND_00665300 [Mycena indigotica]